jgi:5-methyltetrahydrofolate--homocysteine methyltransferase
MPKQMDQQLFDEIISGFVESEPEKVHKAISQCLENGIDAKIILESGLRRGIDKLGVLFERQIIFLPQMMYGAKIFADSFEVLRPRLLENTESKVIGKVLIGTVHGDLHDLGKNMVSFMLSASGFQVIDLGINVPTEEFLKAVTIHHPNILALSSLLTTTMLEQRNVIESLSESGLRESVRVLVGGAPVSERWAKEIGADGYASDSTRAVTVAKSVL